MVQQHKKFILLLVVLVVLPLIGIIAFPYFMYLTVPPDWLLVYEVTEEKAKGGTIIHFDEQNVKDYPVLEEVLLGGEYYEPGPPYSKGDLRQVGEVEYPEKITQWTIDRYIIDNITGEWKYFEYNGSYYRVGTLYAD
jgi:hypothetical protein